MELKKTKRRSGTSGELGVLYEKKLLMLGLYRAIKAKYDFMLDTNIEGVGAFDDVVFTYIEKGGIKQQIYLQAKHKEAKNKKIHYSDLMKSGNDEYALYKYFIDYIETVQNFDEKSKIKSKYFIIYTNIGFNREDKGIESKRKDDKEIRIQNGKSKDDYFMFRKLDLSSHRPLEVFSTVDSFYQFADRNKNDEDEKTRVINVLKSIFKTFDENKKDAKLAKMSEHELDSKLKDYLNKLIFAVDQHDEKNLGNEIKKEIRQTLNSPSQDEVDFIFEYALNEIGQWKGRSKAKPLTKRDNYFEQGEKKFKKFPALYPTLVYENELGSSNIRFKEAKFEELSDFISSEKKFGFIFTKATRLNSLVIYQALNEETLKNEKGVNYGNYDHHFFLTWSDLLKESAQFIFPAFKGMAQSLLIVVHESTDSVNLKTAEIVRDMENIVSVSNNKFIVIAPENCELATELKKKNIVHYNIILNIEFSDLTTQSQEACLTKKKISFRGKDELFSIQQLLGQEETSKLSLSISELEILVKNPTLEIGNSLDTPSNLDSAYYQTNTHIEFEQLNYALEENPADMFVFVGEEHEVKSVLPSNVQKELILFNDGLIPVNRGFILLKSGQEDEQFKQLCYQMNEIQTNLVNPTLHLLRKMNNGWEWTRTYSPDFYIDRHFYPLLVDKNKLKEELLKFLYCRETGEDFFIFSGISEEALYELLKIHQNDEKIHIRKDIAVFLDEEAAKEKFDVCKCLIKNEKSIHLLKVYEMEGQTEIQWYRSEGKLNNMRRLLVNEGIENTPLTETGFAMSTERVVILADEPGMGKTMTLTHIGNIIRKENPHSWVIRIDLNRHQAVLASKQMETLEDLVDFLLNINEELHNPLLHRILINRFTCPRQLVLLWDGFDEVKLNRQDRILKLFVFLQRKTTATIWITTRKHDQEKLENHLSVLAHPFVPLDEAEQIVFLSRFWATTLKLTCQIPNISALKCYADKVIQAFEQSIQAYKTRNFISIPLRARMLSEIYHDKIEKALIKKESFCEFLNDDEKLNIGDLYREFIARKYKIYLYEKVNIGEGLDKPSKTSLMRRYSEAYGILAIKILFDPIFINYNEIEFPLNILSRIGLIQGNEEPVNFIHRTFAEYFAGEFLAKRTNDLNVKIFLKIQLFKKESEVLRRFFDYFFTQDLQLHTAVLNGDISALQKSLELQECSDIETTDGLGRTALHLAAQEGSCDMIHILQNLENDKLSRDEAGKTALHYAASFGHGEVINQMLLNYIEIDVVKLTFRTPLHFAEKIKNRLFDNQKYARYKLVKFVNEQDETGKTSLNYAADNEYWDIACNLLLYFANDNVLTREQKKILANFVKDEIHWSFGYVCPNLVPLVGFLSNIQSSEYLSRRSLTKYRCFQLSIKYMDLIPLFNALIVIIMNKKNRKLFVHKLFSDQSFRFIYRSDEEHSFSDAEYLTIVRFFFEQLTKLKIEIGFEKLNTILSYFANHGFLDTSKYLYEHAVIKKSVFKKLRYFVNKRNAVQATKKVTINLFHNIENLKKDNPWLQNVISINCGVFGWTRLHLAAMNKNVNSIDDFLNPPAYENINHKDDFGNTPLHYAAKMPERSTFIESLFAALRARNSNDRNLLYEVVNAKNNKYKTPLHYVIQKRNLDSAKVLLKSILDIGFNQEQLFNIFNGRDSSDSTPFAHLMHCCCSELIQLLFNYIRYFNFSSQQCMKILNGSYTTLNRFVEYHYVKESLIFVNCMENLPLDDNQRSEIFSGVLHLAAQIECAYEVFQSLLKNGAIFDAHDGDQRTPLDCFYFGNIEEEDCQKAYHLLSSITRLFELIAYEELIHVNEKLDELKELLNDLKNKPWIDPESILNARNREGKTLLDLSKYEEVTNLLQGLRDDTK